LVLPSGTVVKQEYAALSFEVRSEQVGAPLYVFFRGVNFTDDGTTHRQREGCLALYLEVEFSPERSECGRNSRLEPSSSITTLQDQGQATLLRDAARGTGDGAMHSITDFGSTFFTYRDFYVPLQSEADGDWEVMISLQQKFSEHNTLDLLIEVLETEVAPSDLSSLALAHPARPTSGGQGTSGLATRRRDSAGTQQALGSQGPACRGLCHVGGEKAYNEMLRRLEFGAGTYFRVWLMQESPPTRADEADWCANYQLLVSARRPSPPTSSQAQASAAAESCPVDELPSTLNTHRYLLGLAGGQKDFHYRESFRVDHLWHNQAHKVTFRLSEPSVIRIVAPVHRHLEFVLALNQDLGAYNHKTVLTARKEDYHSTLFAQLEAGEYHIKLTFVSDAALLQLPCQTIQLEMAIMTVANAKVKADRLKAGAPAGAASSLSLHDLFFNSAAGAAPLTLFRPARIGWRHVTPGLAPHVD
jgi:hypothetical protein